MKSLLSFAALALLAAAPAFAQQESQETAEPQAATKPHLTVNVQPSLLPNALPAGTTVKMKLETGISTATSKVGDSFAGRVTQDVHTNGKLAIPVGSSIQGRIVRVDDKRRYQGRPVLELRPEQLTLPNGDRYSIIAVVAHTDRESGTKVDSEGRIISSGIDGRDKMEMAGGSAGGELLGGLAVRSTKGALIGSAIGGGSAVIYWLTKRKSASLVAGTEIVMELSRPMAIASASD